MRILDIVEIRIAGPHDAEALYALRSDWELWFDARGIEQWNVGEVPVEFIAAQVEAGEWFVGVDATGAVIGGLRYLTTDPEVWTEETDAAARYVHGLMVDRRRAAPKSGALLLAWAEARAVAEGIALMRLDCVESNS